MLGFKLFSLEFQVHLQMKWGIKQKQDKLMINEFYLFTSLFVASLLFFSGTLSEPAGFRASSSNSKSAAGHTHNKSLNLRKNTHATKYSYYITFVRHASLFHTYRPLWVLTVRLHAYNLCIVKYFLWSKLQWISIHRSRCSQTKVACATCVPQEVRAYHIAEVKLVIMSQESGDICYNKYNTPSHRANHTSREMGSFCMSKYFT